MADDLPAALDDWVRLAGPAKVVAAIRDRALGSHSTDRGPLRCDLNEAERHQVGRLLGTPWAVSKRPVRLEHLAARLPAPLVPLDLAEAIYGAIESRAAVRAKNESSAAAERAGSLETLVAAGVTEAAARIWISDAGLPRPGTGELIMIAQATARVWAAIPESPVHLARLAAASCGDAHALDDDRPLGRAVARLAAAVHTLARPTRSSQDWRLAWRAVGVLCNEVSSRVLTLNVPIHGDSLAAIPGEPIWITLRSLSVPWSVVEPATVFVCENPTVVEAAADEHGARCAPLVCTDGLPSGAALALIAGLARAGCRIMARADFDRAGMTILDQLRTAAPALETWRYDAPTYSTALGAIVDLAPERHGVVHEESLLPLLLSDLATAAAPD